MKRRSVRLQSLRFTTLLTRPSPARGFRDEVGYCRRLERCEDLREAITIDSDDESLPMRVLIPLGVSLVVFVGLPACGFTGGVRCG